MERRNEAFENLIPDPKKPTLNEYYEKFKISFRRIWKNRFLWFWGMFLPGSAGIGFNVEEQLSKLKPEQINSWQTFIESNFESIAFLSAVVLLFWIFIWCISTISRSGVIQSLNCLHNPKNRRKLDCGRVWKMGKKDFKNLLLLDFFIGLAILIVFLILFTPVAIMILTGNQAGAIFIFIILLIFFFFFMVFMNYLFQISTIYVVLANLEIFIAIKLASRLIMRNLFETAKLFSIFFLIGVLQGTVFLLAITAIMPFWGKMMNLWFALYENSFSEWILFSSVLVIVLTVLFLFTKIIFSLWIQDIWLWWVQEIGGNKIELEEKKLIQEEKLMKMGVAIGAKSAIGS